MPVALSMVRDAPSADVVGRILHWPERERRERLVLELDWAAVGDAAGTLPARRLALRVKGDMIDVVFGARSARAWEVSSDGDLSAEVAPLTTLLVRSATAGRSAKRRAEQRDLDGAADGDHPHGERARDGTWQWGLTLCGRRCGCPEVVRVSHVLERLGCAFEPV